MNNLLTALQINYCELLQHLVVKEDGMDSRAGRVFNDEVTLYWIPAEVVVSFFINKKLLNGFDYDRG